MKAKQGVMALVGLDSARKRSEVGSDLDSNRSGQITGRSGRSDRGSSRSRQDPIIDYTNFTIKRVQIGTITNSSRLPSHLSISSDGLFIIIIQGSQVFKYLIPTLPNQTTEASLIIPLIPPVNMLHILSDYTSIC